LQKVEGGALGRKQGAGLGVYFAERLAGGNQIAVAGVPGNDGERVERTKTGAEPGSAGQYRILPADDAAMRTPCCGGEQRRQVATADILDQGGEHVAFDLCGKLKREFHDMLMRQVKVRSILALEVWRPCPASSRSVSVFCSLLRSRSW
jgi:hypothetical protein